jgi:hypothetical protein
MGVTSATAGGTHGLTDTRRILWQSMMLAAPGREPKEAGSRDTPATGGDDEGGV